MADHYQPRKKPFYARGIPFEDRWDDYGALQEAIMRDPDAGPVIPGSGGVRKLRWAAQGRGKRGGYRVIYYVRRVHGTANLSGTDRPTPVCHGG
ncbi:MAG TPA: hypothetical protein VFF50_07470, partial [Candidatus Deferrimicrobiaceae bacterium]|nr:hypothetical protein [Candidatus Deferrimicrobiaceae bacterium]